MIWTLIWNFMVNALSPSTPACWKQFKALGTMWPSSATSVSAPSFSQRQLALRNICQTIVGFLGQWCYAQFRLADRQSELWIDIPGPWSRMKMGSSQWNSLSDIANHRSRLDRWLWPSACKGFSFIPLQITDLDLIADLDHLRVKHCWISCPVRSCKVPTRGQTQRTQVITEALK